MILLDRYIFIFHMRKNADVSRILTEQKFLKNFFHLIDF